MRSDGHSTAGFENFEAQPTLIGSGVVLRPLRVDDRQPMIAAAADPLIWELHPASDRHRAEVFGPYFDERLATGGALAVSHRSDGHILGMSSYAPVESEEGAIEIGWTFLRRSAWGGGTNREMKRLMVNHAAATFDVVIFRVAETNLRSRRAVEKLGARLRPGSVGVNVSGRECPHVVYALQVRTPTAHRSPPPTPEHRK